MMQVYRELNDKFISDNERNDVNRPLPKEALRIMKDKFDDFVAYGVKHNLNENEYNSMLWKTRSLLKNIYDFLDYPSFTKQDDRRGDFEGKPKRLWRICNSDIFACGSKIWEVRDTPGFYHYSPVGDIDDDVSKYLEMQWLHHPYINWSLINAYLLDAGRKMIRDYNDDLRAADMLESLSLSKSFEARENVDVGGFIFQAAPKSNF